MNSFSERLTYYRTLAGLSQAELAKKIGVTSTQISRYETGTSSPRPNILSKLSEVLNVAIADLIPPPDNSWQAAVKIRMKEIGISQYTLAEKLECTQGAVAHWLSGRRQPDIEVINKILQAVGLPILSIGNNLQSMIPIQSNFVGGKIQYPTRLIIQSEYKGRSKDIDFRYSANENQPLVNGIKSTLLNFLSDTIEKNDDLLKIIDQLDLTEIRLTFKSDSNDLPK